MDLGARLKFIRNKLGLSLEQVSAMFDITGGTLSRYENGNRTPDHTFLEAFGKKYNLCADWLLYGELPIFKAIGEDQKDSSIVFLELSRLIHQGKFSRNPMPDVLRIPMEKLSEETPDNYMTLLGYMFEDDDVRKNMFQFFYLFQKPLADKKKEP